MGNNGPRFQATADRDEIGHSCCYRAAVIDTTAPKREGLICETWTLQDAIEIADALNARAMQR